MKKCFEIDQDGNVHQGIRIDVFNTLSDGTTKPSIVVGGKGISSHYGVMPIYRYNARDDDSPKEVIWKDDRPIRYTDKDNRVYGLWIEHKDHNPILTFDNTVAKPDQFGSSRALIAFRTNNRCIGIDAYTCEIETITCLDKMCRLQYVGNPRSMARRCHKCGAKVKSTFKPFPGNILAQGDAFDDGDAQVGKEIVATLPMGYVFRVALTKDEDKNPIERYYQFNGGDIDSLGMFQEDKHGYIKESKTT